MKQRSKEWFEARKGRITASTAGAILGNAPYMTRDDAMRNMVREALGLEREFQGNVATQYGVNNEEGALTEYRIETMHEVEEVGFITRDDWAGCSPDGLVGSAGGVEIKCPYGLRKEGDHKSIFDQPHYVDQIQFSLWVTQREWWHAFQWSPRGTKLEVLGPSEDWQDENLPKLRQFHAEYLHELEHNPDEYSKPKRAVIDTPEAHKVIAEWDEIGEQMELLAERKRDLLDAITSMSDGRDMDFAGRKVTLTERAGSVSYARVVKDHCKDVDLEPYRGKPSRFWRVT